jgi:TonB family protein
MAMDLKHLLLCLLAPGISAAQQVTPETGQRPSDSVEAYYRKHPEMRPEVLRITGPIPVEEGRPEGLCARPVYPKESLRAEEQGRVDLEFLINSDGRAVDTRVKKSSGFPLLDKAALDGLSKCRYKSATEDGKPVLRWIAVSYTFSLQ